MTPENNFVAYAYQTFLGRAADTAGLAWWTEELESKAVTTNQLPIEMIGSNEFKNQGLPVCALYYTLFGRAPDLPGLTYWRTANQKGVSLSTIADKLMASDEYTNVSSGKTAEEMLRQFYGLGLGRDPDHVGFEYWLSQIQTGMSLAEVAARFAESAEAEQHLEKPLAISALYSGLTEKIPTADQMAIGLALPLENLALSLMLSDAYKGPAVFDLKPTGLIAYTGADDVTALTLTGVPAGGIHLDLSQSTPVLTENGSIVPFTGLDAVATVDAGSLSVDVTLVGSDADVVFTGGSRGDTLTGGAGNDQLDGRGGTDIFKGGGGDDIFVITDQTHSSGLAEIFDGGEGTDRIRFDFSGAMNFTDATISGVESILFNDNGNRLTLSPEQLNSVTSFVGAADAADSIILSAPGLIQITENRFTDIETFQGGDSGSNDIIDGSGRNLTLIGGNGADYIEGGMGADALQGNGGSDAFGYLLGNHSRYTGGTAFTGDTITGFDFAGQDKIRLANAFDGTAASLTMDSVWLSTWAVTLENNMDLQTAFADSDIDAVLLTVNDGSASGQYLLIEDGTTSTGFQSAEDFTIKLTGAVNQSFFDGDDFII